MGGYFMLNMMAALTASFVATHAYHASASEPVMPAADTWNLILGLGAAWSGSFALFLVSIKRKYVATFFSTQTGYQYVQAKFAREGDENKSKIFKYNHKQWLSIREEVKEWTSKNWERWEEEQPDWFTDKWKAKVHDGFIPPHALSEMRGAYARSRSTALSALAGSEGERAGAAAGAVVPVLGGGTR
jgi:hypothetical protein